MSQTFTFHIKSNTPDELVFLLDSLISSPLCMHTKDWICYLYLHSRSWVAVELGVMICHFEGGRFLVQYGNSSDPVPLNLTELLSHILNLDKPYSRIFCVEQVRAWKLTTNQTASPSLCHYINEHTQSPEFNPAVWFALRGTYTLADFFNGRSLPKFIEMHIDRLLSQCKQASLNTHWQLGCHQDGRNRCRCPGHHLVSILVPLPPNFTQPCAPVSKHQAELVMEEIVSHIDLRIIRFMWPEVDEFEDMRRNVSEGHDGGSFRPNSPVRSLDRVSVFTSLAALVDYLFEEVARIKDDPDVISMVKTQLSEEFESLASKIDAQ